MHIRAENLGAQFSAGFLFRNLSFELAPGSSLAVLGANGSGKSTLLRILAGQLEPSEGKLTCTHSSEKVLEREAYYREVCWAAPSLDLYGALTLAEAYRLHFRFKRCSQPGPEACIEILVLAPHSQKPLRTLSSGLLQRAKVGLALFSEGSLLLLDEPTSNLDAPTAEKMKEWITTYLGTRTLVLASNLPREYELIADRLLLG